MPGFEVFGEEEKKQVNEVLDTGILFRYEFGEQRKNMYKVREFEEAFARYTGAGHAQAVSSGTAALKVALAALGVGAGDEVITQGFTFVATWEAILDVGAIPVFTEIDDTLNMDPDDLKKKITDKTRAVIPVHMLGAQARIREIRAIADSHGLAVIEDTAQAAGGRLDGKFLGTWGHCGTFSFDSVKTMTTGEGGMCITDDPHLWRCMSEYQDHGHDHAVNPGGRGGEGRSFVGFNFRMMELQGAIGLAQLAKLDDMISSQKSNKAFMKEVVSKLPGVGFRTILDEEGDSSTFIAFMMPDAEQARSAARMLSENGAAPIRWGENTWHFYPSWEHFHGEKTLCTNGWPFKAHGKSRFIYSPEMLPVSAELMARTLCYPVPVKLADIDKKKFADAVEKAAGAM